MEKYTDILHFHILNEIWLYNITNQVYLITLLMVFSLVAYLFIKSRSGDSFVLSTSEQYHFLNTITRYSETADVIIDNKFVVRFANDKFLDLFKLTEDIDNQPFDKIGLPVSFVDFIKTGDMEEFETELLEKENRFKVNRAPVTTHDGQLIGSLIKINMNTRDLIESNTSEWMHELNTPLNAIMGYSELLVDESNLTESQREHLKIIHEHSQILKNRIDKLLTNSDMDGVLNKSNKLNKKIENILIVDDVSINRTLLKIILNRYGYTVSESENGKEALKSLSNHKFDLVLMDLSMPIMDGIEATEKIRSMNTPQSNLPIIAVTASSRYKNIDNLKARGFNALLKKPFKENQLIDIINQFEFN